jgi:hypothetical protein
VEFDEEEATLSSRTNDHPVVLQCLAGLVSGEQEVMGQSPAGEPSSQWKFAGSATRLE